MRFKLNSEGIYKYTYALNKRLNTAKNIIALDIFNNLMVFSPVRTGKLRSSYVIQTNAQVISIKNDCGYCKYVNDGTVYQAGQHFIERSIIDALATFERKENQIKKV